MTRNKILALTTGVVAMVVAGLVLALMFGAFGRGPDQTAGTETAVVRDVAGAPSVGVKVSGVSALTDSGPEAVVAGSEPSSVERSPSKLAPARPQTAPSGGSGEGIQVHGHWTIEIREPNGTLVSHHEFENALTPFGHVRLTQLLGREESVGLWEVNVLGPIGANGPCTSPSEPEFCELGEPTSINNRAYGFYNLAVDVIPPVLDPADPFLQTVLTAGALVLSGTATAQQDGAIASVFSGHWVCATTIAPASPCQSPGGFGGFTRTDLPANVPVLDGQSIQVTVRITFS